MERVQSKRIGGLGLHPKELPKIKGQVEGNECTKVMVAGGK